MKKYKCIKSFSIPEYNDDGFVLEEEETIVNSNTIWFIPENEDYRLIGGEIRLEDEDFGWIEITKDNFNDFFKEMKL